MLAYAQSTIRATSQLIAVLPAHTAEPDPQLTDPHRHRPSQTYTVVQQLVSCKPSGHRPGAVHTRSNVPGRLDRVGRALTVPIGAHRRRVRLRRGQMASAAHTYRIFRSDPFEVRESRWCRADSPRGFGTGHGPTRAVTGASRPASRAHHPSGCESMVRRAGTPGACARLRPGGPVRAVPPGGAPARRHTGNLFHGSEVSLCLPMMIFVTCRTTAADRDQLIRLMHHRCTARLMPVRLHIGPGCYGPLATGPEPPNFGGWAGRCVNASRTRASPY